jgi:BirA family transcriptional regulator, biotin operon repressor / biotin---[acetyl-CoA-carboxylase] ligase
MLMAVERFFCYRFDQLDSTNAWAMRNAKKLARHPFSVVVANEQTAGRGRMGRSWTSPPNCNLYITFFFVVPSYEDLDRIAQLLALSAATALQTSTTSLVMKWPNDLLLNGKKLAGILCETTPLEGGIGVAAGIGINVNADQEELSTVGQPATSLLLERGTPQDRELLLEALVKQFQQDLKHFLAHGFAPFEASLERLLQRT